MVAFGGYSRGSKILQVFAEVPVLCLLKEAKCPVRVWFVTVFVSGFVSGSCLGACAGSCPVRVWSCRVCVWFVSGFVFGLVRSVSGPVLESCHEN